MAAKMTPGPWRYEPSTKTIRSVPANHWLATMDSWDCAVDSHEANARAIACLPELVEAARTLLVAAEKYVDTASPWHGDILRMRRILARIDGGD